MCNPFFFHKENQGMTFPWFFKRANSDGRLYFVNFLNFQRISSKLLVLDRGKSTTNLMWSHSIPNNKTSTHKLGSTVEHRHNTYYRMYNRCWLSPIPTAPGAVGQQAHWINAERLFLRDGHNRRVLDNGPLRVVGLEI